MFTKGRLQVLGLVAILVLLMDGGRAVALDVEDIKIITATERQDGVIFDHFFEVKIEGTGIENVVFQDQTTLAWYGLDYDAGKNAWVYRDDGYAQLADLYAVHPNNVGYYFFFNVDEGPTWEDVVLLGYARHDPTDYVHITFPTHMQTGVPLSFEAEFDFVGWAEIRGMKLIEDNDGVVLGEEYTTELDVNTWPVGPLGHGHQYSIEVGAWSVVGGTPLVLSTLYEDAFTYTGLVVDSNRVSFITTAPEPASMTLLGAGLVAGGWLRRRRRK